jgi:hypothetical protein
MPLLFVFVNQTVEDGLEAAEDAVLSGTVKDLGSVAGERGEIQE